MNNNQRTLLSLFILAIPLFAQYSFDFVCTSDTFQTGTDYFVYYFRLTNNGSQPDSYAFDCRVVDSVSGWFEIYCVGGQCAEPGIILYDYLTPGATDTGIDISVYPAPGVWGTEVINLKVWSLHNPALIDSINVYAAMEQGIYDYGAINSSYEFEVYPNPFTNHCVIKYRIPRGASSNQYPVVSIKIFDATGWIVKSFNHLTDSPFNQIIWYGNDANQRQIPEGIYFIELQNGKDRIQRKVVKIR